MPRAKRPKVSKPLENLVIERARPETLRLRAVSASLTVDDLDRSFAFYTEVLGFVVAERWEEDGKLIGATLKAGRCEIGLSQDDWAQGRDRKKGEGIRLWCETTQDIDALAVRIRRAGHELTHEPKDHDGGIRSFYVDDPDGYHLTFFRPLGR